MTKQKKQSPASAVIAASLEMAHEDAQRRTQESQPQQQPPPANSFAEREKKRRYAKVAWAQNVIQTQYAKYGLESEDFKWIWLRWYLIFLAAYRLPNFHEFSASQGTVWNLLHELPADQQERLLDFHMQLASDGPRSIKAKWQDRGIPIYHWLNRAFAREWDNLSATQAKSSIRNVPLITDEDFKNAMEDQDANLAIDVERYDGDDVVAPEPWFEEGTHGAERVRQNNSLVWNTNLNAYTRQSDAWLHPGHKIGVPVWTFIREFRAENAINAVIVDTITETGKVNYSEIARRLNAAGLEVNHDKIRRIALKFTARLKEVRDSDENRHSRYNSRANALDDPSYVVPGEEQAKRDQFHNQSQDQAMSMDEARAAYARWSRSTPIGRALSVLVRVEGAE